MSAVVAEDTSKVPTGLEGVLAEVRKTKDTASRLADGDYPESADHVRVLAGLISQLSEQVERIGESIAPSGDTPDRS